MELVSEDKSIASCPTCGMPLVFGHRDRWSMKDIYWCRNVNCEDHLSPVVVPA